VVIEAQRCCTGGAALHLMSQASSVPTTIQLYNRVELPAIGLGTFKARGKSLKAIVACALHCGIRHIDTASVYKASISQQSPCNAMHGAHSGRIPHMDMCAPVERKRDCRRP